MVSYVKRWMQDGGGIKIKIEIVKYIGVHTGIDINVFMSIEDIGMDINMIVYI